MGKIYLGVSDTAKQIKTPYIGGGGVAKKIKKIYLGVAGVAKMVWVGFDPTLPTYAGWSYYPDYHGSQDILMTFVNRQKLIDAQSAGYTQLRFTLSILHYGANGDEVGIGINNTSYFNGTYVFVPSSETTTKTQTFTLNLSDMINSGATNFYLVHNATRTTSADEVYMALSNPNFI